MTFIIGFISGAFTMLVVIAFMKGRADDDVSGLYDLVDEVSKGEQDALDAAEHWRAEAAYWKRQAGAR